MRHYAFAVNPGLPNTCSLRSYLPCYRKACVQINYETVKDFAIKLFAKWSAIDRDNLLHIAQSILTTPCRSYFPLFIGSTFCSIVTHEPEVIETRYFTVGHHWPWPWKKSQGQRSRSHSKFWPRVVYRSPP